MKYEITVEIDRENLANQIGEELFIDWIDDNQSKALAQIETREIISHLEEAGDLDDLLSDYVRDNPETALEQMDEDDIKRHLRRKPELIPDELWAESIEYAPQEALDVIGAEIITKYVKACPDMFPELTQEAKKPQDMTAEELIKALGEMQAELLRRCAK